jgi:uncharacterized flavoprotein (TIGR03862 family)
MNPKKIGIVGTGPAALMAGTILAENGFKVHFFDQKKAPARKFLVAGHGGFNLTHSQQITEFIENYDKQIIKTAVREYTNADFQNFLIKLNIPTYTGSSGKIFPIKGIKPIDVLNNWLDYLKNRGAIFSMEHELVDFSGTSVVMRSKGQDLTFDFDSVIFSLGGASWSKTGSTGKWLDLFRSKKISCLDFGSSNSGFELSIASQLLDLKGSSIKNCRLFSERMQRMGDIVITEYGIEGSPVYAMNWDYRCGNTIYIDFKPSMDEQEIVDRIRRSRNSTEALKQLKLSKGALTMIKTSLTKEQFTNELELSKAVKRLKITIDRLRPLDEVISAVGGIELSELTPEFELISTPGAFCIGEMVDWDAPTGGYLIQGCISMGVKAARKIADQS